MNKKTEELEIKRLVEDYIDIMEKCDEERFLALWHPDARRFGLGNDNQLHSFTQDEIVKYSIAGLKNLKEQIPNPEIIKFTVNEIVHISVSQGVIASAEVKWQMVLPGSKGVHHTFIQFAKKEDEWFIVNVLDKGFEMES
ncbi:MAG: nuclear transport factor 2 family protein [Candidatus Heimdallarchaeota archaeon]|nr:nuclear transport factor 2 family protein [Candidatus Heimdallarchaeota archaeon]MBY8994852.1 nuclear transport factor 2 family protein [Candidatus Heimdallarchaeota archaeon]